MTATRAEQAALGKACVIAACHDSTHVVVLQMRGAATRVLSGSPLTTPSMAPYNLLLHDYLPTTALKNLQ